MKFRIPLLLCLLTPFFDLQASNAGCQYYVDELKLPRLKADTPTSLWACLGYVHAHYRGYQMEFFRRAAKGQLSEIYGFSKLKSDIFLRLLKFPEVAARLFQELTPEALEILNAYSRGATRGLQNLAPQQASKFRHYGLTSTEWTPTDTLAILMLQSFFQSKRGFEMEVRAERLAEHLKLDDVSAYRNDLERPWATPIIKPSELPQAASVTPTQKTQNQRRLNLQPETYEALLKTFDIPELRFHGSNNFVIAPSRSESGHALLGNDPHLEIYDPQYFMWVSLNLPDSQIVGATVPGIPGIPIGMNQHMAWGLTNSFFDVADIVIVDSRTTKIISERPTIPIKLGPLKIPFFFKSIEWVDSDIPRPILPLDSDRLQSHEKLALHWSGYHMSGKSVANLFQLPFSKTSRDFDQKLQKAELPSWHFVFADTKGHIGFRTTGLLPKMLTLNEFGFKRPPQTPVEFLSPLEAPSLFNPPRGYIVTANNQPWPKDYRLSAGHAFEPGFRAFRIEEILEITRAKWSFTNIHELQCDYQAPDSRFLLPHLKELVSNKDPMTQLSNDERNHLQSIVDQPALNFTMDCKECTLHAHWLDTLRRETRMDESDFFYWLTSDQVEPRQRRKTLYDTFRTSYADLKSAQALQKPWGEIHRNDHLPIGESTRDQKFAVYAPGAYHSVSLGQSHWQEGDEYFQMTYAPSSRFLVELSQPPRARFVQPAQNLRENDDLPFSQDPMSQAWAKCEYQSLALGFDTSKPAISADLK